MRTLSSACATYLALIQLVFACACDWSGGSVADSGGTMLDGALDAAAPGPTDGQGPDAGEDRDANAIDGGRADDSGPARPPDAQVLDAAELDGAAGDASRERIEGYAATSDSLYAFVVSTRMMTCQAAPPCPLSPDGKLVRRDLRAGTSTELFMDRVVPSGLTVPAVATPDRLFFASSGLHSIALSGGSVSTVDLDYDPRWGLVEEDGWVYYVSSPVGAPSRGLMRVKATNVPTLVLSPSETLFLEHFDVHAEYIYITALCLISSGAAYEVAWCPRAGVYRAPIATGALELVVSFPAEAANPVGINVNDSTIVWASSDSTGTGPVTLYSSGLLPGATARRLYPAATRFSAMALDSTSVYLCTSELHQIALASGEARLLDNEGCFSPQRVGDKLWRLTWDRTVEALTVSN